ncbi:nucleolar and coiled-body phosphoprotein 1 [Chrysoperla carnea]|uniref:nucleolar and coiled-body phosphoprotein 1 n=1 Tax=Chrysoperla carnea TaxID=189513 RepID=UPI001D071142|nr:nucleolar and coiled-body phosphoprotein 1 [Chrysoperla carnea]
MAATAKIKTRGPPVRQQSISSSIPQKHVLKKQLSEGTYSSKVSEITPPRIAWADDNNTKTTEKSVEIVAKKCPEYPKPKQILTPSPKSEPVFYSRQQLAERLRKAWKERETNSKSIDIFLARSITDDVPVISRESSTMSVNSTKNDSNFNTISKQEPKPKEVDIEQQKKLTKKISLVISPLFRETIDQDFDPSEPNPNETKIPEKPQLSIEIKPRSMSAATKRELFRKSSTTKTQLDETIELPNNTKPVTSFRPPLTRSQSVPTTPVPMQNPPTKNKFPSKRRLKTAPIRRNKSIDTDGSTKSSSTTHNAHKPKGKKKGPLVRCQSATAAEIVTMVSLTSPPMSDSEENAQKQAANLARIRKQNQEKKVEMNAKLEAQRLITLKKIVKQVSFQQTTPSLPVRNSSANSYLARRNSTAFPLFRPTRSSVLQMANEREKRAQNNSVPGEESEPKRRLLYDDGNVDSSDGAQNSETKNTNSGSNYNSQDGSGLLEGNRYKILDEQNEVTKNSKEIPETAKIIPNDSSKPSGENEASTEDEPIFENPKERQCWKLFKKMRDKGVEVSFDTILKGLLTPTEYRLRSKASIITEQSSKEEEEVPE